MSYHNIVWTTYSIEDGEEGDNRVCAEIYNKDLDPDLLFEIRFKHTYHFHYNTAE